MEIARDAPDGALPTNLGGVSILDDAREGMDPDVRPQDDLFGHVNGRWLAEADIPADRSSWGAFVQLADVAEEQVAAIIEDLAKVATDADEGTELNADAQKIGDLFASFMDTERIDRLGTRPVKPLLDAVTALRDVRDMAAFLGEFERLGGHGLFGSYVNTDDRNSDRYLFHLVQGGLGLPDESYYRDEKFAAIREAYVAYLATVLGLVDAHDGQSDPEAGARTVLDIDTKLAGGHWERADTRDVQRTYNLKTVAELRELCPAFDWDVYITNLSASAHEADELLAEVCVRQPSYFEHLSTVLGEVSIEDWRTWLLTRVLRSSAPYLTDDFVEANFDFYGRTLNGTPELRARWKRGVGLVEGAIGEAVGKEYVARHFPPSSKQQMDELVANLLTAYRESIGQLDWMTEETKAKAYEKLDTFRPKIGYPEKFRDYSALRIRPDDLLGNVAAAAAFETGAASSAPRSLGESGPAGSSRRHCGPWSDGSARGGRAGSAASTALASSSVRATTTRKGASDERTSGGARHLCCRAQVRGVARASIRGLGRSGGQGALVRRRRCASRARLPRRRTRAQPGRRAGWPRLPL